MHLQSIISLRNTLKGTTDFTNLHIAVRLLGLVSVCRTLLISNQVHFVDGQTSNPAL